MVTTFYVTCLIVLLVGSASAYSEQCAIGPEYWCKSFENAQDCGAVYHCTSTVWAYDNKYTETDSSTSCQWCERVLENTNKALEQIGDNQDLITFTLIDGCNSLLNNDLSSKCANIVQNYGTSVVSLMKNKRYATLCRLMSWCSNEIVTEKPDVILGNQACTWGPSYWCASLSNTRECQSIEHCSQRVWSQQALSSTSKDTVCQYCEYIMEKLRSIVNENETEVDIENWLSKTCSMLAGEDLVNECKAIMSQYTEEITVLLKTNIDTSIICHLGQLCKNGTLIARITDEVINVREESPQEQSRMLCNAVVRATHDLFVKQQSSYDDVHQFLKNDCQTLSTSELIEKCENLVEKYGNKIYYQISQNMDSSKICDNLDSSVDLTEVQSVPCQLCTFVLSNMKQMVDNEESKEDILQRLDEQLCSRWDGDMRTLCQYTIETRGGDLIENIQRGTHPMLLCTYFQVCLDDIYNKCSPIGRDDMRAFLKENVCYQLGTFEDSCYAIMDGDTNRLLHSLVNNKDGQVLCNLFGICSMNTSIIAELSVNDDADKCKRCIRDFTRRKFIAEKLLNNTAEFLHHFCGRLPQEDECTKAVDDSINQLAQFIQSLNPQDICQELKVCNETALQVMQPIAISESDNVLSEQILLFVKTTICSGLGSLSKLCENLVNSEGANALSLIAKDLDPHQVCDVLDICPMKTSDESCPNSCESCTTKVKNYQGELAAFLYGMLSEAENICQYISESQDCRNTVSGFQLTIDTIIERFKPKRVCQVLTHCLSSPPECTLENDKCSCCQEHLKFRLNNFRTVIDQITTTSVNLCNEKSCHSYFQLTLQQIINQMDKVNSLRLCQRFGICSATMSFRLIPTLLNSMSSASQNLGSYIEQYAENVCSEFGDYKSICEHLITSSQNIYYRNIYIALLKNDPTVIDNSLSEQQADNCDQCKTQVQTSKDFWTKELEVVRNALLQTCEHCSAKDQCQEFYNERFDNIKSYLDSINPEQVCQKMHLCSVSVQNTCSVCVERLQLRKDAMVQAIGRLTVYFTDLCQQNAGQECQTLTQQMHDLMQISIEEFNANETCTEIGFCTTDDTETDADFDAYEESLTNEIENSVCSILGPFAALCTNIIQGNTAEIENSPLNYDLKDLMHMESESSESSSSESEIDLGESKGDKCKCCLARVMQRKRHMKFIGDKIFWAHIRACNRCPAKQQCRRHWRMAKERFDERIKRICPMRVCIHLGYCNKSSEAMRPDIQKVETIDRSNSTCILCEYAMSILSNYLKPESTEEEIKESLQKMCSELPSILQNQCYEYIDDYGPAIIAILVRDLDPSTVCHKLNLCTNTMNFDVTHLTKANTTTCGICDYIATYFHFILQRDPSKKSTQHGVSTVCKNLADEQNAKCQTLALLFGPYFEELQLSPGNNFCKELTICQTPMTDLEPAITIKDPEDAIIETDQSTGVFYGDDSVTYHEETTSTTTQNLDVTPQCAICLYVMSYLDAVLKYNKSEEAIEEALEKVCTIIPAKQRTECEQLISTYGPILTDFIANNADPKVVCTFLSMCTDPSTVKSTTVSYYVDDGGLESTSSTTSSIPDSEFYDEEESLETPSSTAVSTTSTKQYAKCIFGMSYWCTSHANAVLCNAVELCELHVWSKNKISHE